MAPAVQILRIPQSPLMAYVPVQPEQHKPPQLPLHCQTWVLKVSVHCEGCKRKVQKVLRSIEGVCTTNIDIRQKKVAVTGNTDAQTLIRKLVKAGKHAELWPGKAAGGQEKKHAKGNESKSCVNGGRVRFTGAETVTVEKFPAAWKSNGGGGGGGQGRKGNKSNNIAGAGAIGAPAGTGMEGFRQVVDQINLSPPSQNVYHYPPSYAPRQAYVACYNAAHPMGRAAPGYYIPPSPCTYARQEVYRMQPTPFDSFEILSDENPNGCYIL